MRKFYIVYAALLLGLLGAVQYFGWTLTRTEDVKDVPPSVRSDPGAYRSHYFWRGK